MELTLQSLSPRCYVSGRDFVEGDRVMSFLARGPVVPAGTGKAADEAVEGIVRCDVLESAQGDFMTPGPVICRWVQVVKARKLQDNPERNLKLSAESLFLALSDPANERSVENERLLQVLALMLERKRVLKPKGRTADKQRVIYEHSKAKTLHEVEAAELSPEFFLSIQQQLSALVGGSSAAKAGTVAGQAV